MMVPAHKYFKQLDFIMKRIVVSMTSYPKRIRNVSISIYLLLEKQTVKPDEIHLWLSVEEFPNKEKDLPEDLNLVVQSCEKVSLHWLDRNTYVHKRHEIFKTVGDAYVFLIDDDVRYADNLIETVVGKAEKYPGTIVCYNRYDRHRYSGKHILYGQPTPPNYPPDVNEYRWCGQSMIPSSVYPKECLTEENQRIRDNTSPVSDECWFQPWIVKNDIPIVHCSYGWGEDIDKDNGKKQGLVAWSHQKDENGYERRDIWLNNVLSAYPDIMEKYKRLFNYGE